MKKLIFLFLFPIVCLAGQTTSTINLCEKILDDKGALTSIHVIVELDRVLNGKVIHSWRYENQLDPSALSDIKGAIEKWLSGDILNTFNREADKLEALEVPVKIITKQPIDTAGIVLDIKAEAVAEVKP